MNVNQTNFRNLSKKKIAIIGSGISGLTAAWFLSKKNHKITIFEKESRAGGWIASNTEKNFFFERGPRSFNTSRSQDLLALLNDLNLSSNIIYSSEESKERYLYLDDKLQKIPSSLFSLLTSSLTRKYIPTLFKEIFKSKDLKEDETIYSFVKRRFNEDIALKFFDPITTGIYGGSIKDLSINSCFPFFHHFEKKYGSVVKGIILKKREKTKNALFTLQDGLYQIVETILSQKNIKMSLSSNVENIIEGTDKVKIYINNKELMFDFVIIATPYSTIKNLFNKLPFKLDSIDYKTLGVINLGFNSLSLPYKGFGYLVPRISNENLLGVVFDSNIFKEQNKKNQTRMTFMLDVQTRIDNIEIYVQEILKRHLNILQSPDYMAYNVCKNAIPQYNLGHQNKIDNFSNNIKKTYSKILFTGNYFENISVSGCIKKSKEIINKLEI